MTIRAGKYFHAANILVAAVGAATGTGTIAVAGSTMSGVGSLLELAKNWPNSTDSIVRSVEQELVEALKDTHLSETQRRLVPQMIEGAAISAETIMACARDADTITEQLLKGCPADPSHRNATAQDGFRRVVAPIVRRLLLDPSICDTLRPAHEMATAQILACLQAKQKLQTSMLEEQTQGISQIRDMLFSLLTDRDTTADVLVALRAMGNSLPSLPEISANIEAALKTGDTLTARASLDQALAYAEGHRHKAATAKAEAERQHKDAADAEARLILLDAELIWKAKNRLGALRRLKEAHGAAATPALRDEIDVLQVRRFNLTIHLQQNFMQALAIARTTGMPEYDVVTFSTLIAKAPDFAQAEAVRAEMVAAGVKPN
ncbi:hypothetical protein M2324_004026, partial [Rhodovulum sulfidophilum]|nr:hypothetical protein [Rhodovulum sulfidophilum]